MENKESFSTNLSDLEPYIKGKKFNGVARNVVRCDTEVLKTFLTMIEEDPIAKNFFEVLTVSADFYKIMVDFNHFIPKEMRQEVFYAAKLGKIYPEVPSFCAYLVSESWKQANGIPNLVMKILPTNALKKFFEEGYFADGVCLQDVIQNLCCEAYRPLSCFNPKNKIGTFTEIYVRDTDMVAAVPNSIADALDDMSINNIRLTPNGLETGGMLLRSMCSYVGAINSYYDLRELL